MKYFHVGPRDLYISVYVDHVTRLGNFFVSQERIYKIIFF